MNQDRTADMSQDPTDMSQDATEDEAIFFESVAELGEWYLATNPAMLQRLPSIAKVMESEADLREWFLATNTVLRELGLQCPRALYKEMRRDLRHSDAIVSVIPAFNEDEYERMINELFSRADEKPSGRTLRVRQLCPAAPIYVLTSKSSRRIR